MSIKKLEKEINDIHEIINNCNNYYEIYDKYENYSKSMLDFIKSKDKMYFKMLFSLISEKLKNNIKKDDLYYELNEYINNKIVNTIIDSIYCNNNDKSNDSNNSDTIEDNSSDIYEDDYEPLEKNISNFKWRENQNLAISNTIEQNFSSGIHAQVMGSGKSHIILNTIHKHNELYKTKKMYIISCFRQEILRDMFFDKNNNLNEEKIKFLQTNDIINLNDYNIIDRVNIKEKNLNIKIFNKKSHQY